MIFPDKMLYNISNLDTKLFLDQEQPTTTVPVNMDCNVTLFHKVSYNKKHS